MAIEAKAFVLPAVEDESGAASATATAAIRSVGIFVSDFSDTLAAEVFRVLDRETRKHGLHAFAVSLGPEPADIATHFGPMATHIMAGAVILSTPRNDAHNALRQLSGMRVPGVIVSTGGYIPLDPEQTSADFFVCDIADTIGAAGQYLLAAGRQRVLLVLEGDGALESRIVDRWSAIHSGAGVALDSSLIVMEIHDANDAEETVLGFLREMPGAFDAVVAASDSLAAGVLRGCRRVRRFVGRRHTDEIEVICAVDSPLCPLLDPPVSAFAIPMQVIARQCVERLIRHIADPALWKAENVVLAAKFVARGSA